MIEHDEEFLEVDYEFAEFIGRRAREFHRRFNPTVSPYGQHYDISSGVNIRPRDVLGYSAIQRLKQVKHLPYVVAYEVADPLFQPVVTTEVSSSGGADTYHATPGASGGLLGFFGWLFGWDE